jgi:hypothetical protein
VPEHKIVPINTKIDPTVINVKSYKPEQGRLVRQDKLKPISLSDSDEDSSNHDSIRQKLEFEFDQKYHLKSN